MKTKLCVAISLVFALVLSGCGGGATGSYDGAPSSAAAGEAPALSTEAADNAGFEGDFEVCFAEDDPLTGEAYLVIDENRAKSAAEQDTLTFSLKVDTASYTNVARYIESGNLPPRDAVRTEELINYFSYDGAMEFDGDSPFALTAEVGPSPFRADRQMALVRVKTRDIDKESLPPCNLTFLIDTSGSMDSYDKLPLLKQAFEMLVETLGEDDKVSIVTYAGSSGVVLDSVSGADKVGIVNAMNHLDAGGSTAGADGILTAYALAEKNFVKDGNNRVILATDGDFNVGVSDVDALADLVSEKRGNGVYLSILGFGTGNIRDDIMETLSKNGNGNYAYIHSAATARKVLVEELASNLYAAADDVKAQIVFNPEAVSSYRLIGYENRRLRNEDFDDDSKDAGEIGVGSDVVVLFELELQNPATGALLDQDSKLFDVRIRYKDPGGESSRLIERPVWRGSIVETGSADHSFACSVAAFGHLLRDSEYLGDATLEEITALAKAGLGRDEKGYRLEYLLLLKQAESILG